MLTVKHIAPDGKETVFPALEVTYDPFHFTPTPVGQSGYIWYEAPSGAGLNHRLEDGTVYVMNEAGATVARYVLSTAQPMTAAEAQSGLGSMGAQALNPHVFGA